jgi:hypothetical protein
MNAYKVMNMNKVAMQRHGAKNDIKNPKGFLRKKKSMEKFRPSERLAHAHLKTRV